MNRFYFPKLAATNLKKNRQAYIPYMLTCIFAISMFFILDSFWKIFLPGLKVTIPLTVISFSIALVIATAMAMVQFANIKGLRQIARF